MLGYEFRGSDTRNLFMLAQGEHGGWGCVTLATDVLILPSVFSLIYHTSAIVLGEQRVKVAPTIQATSVCSMIHHTGASVLREQRVKVVQAIRAKCFNLRKKKKKCVHALLPPNIPVTCYWVFAGAVNLSFRADEREMNSFIPSA